MNQISAVRRSRLLRLLSERYRGNKSALADEIGVSPTAIARIFWEGEASRNIGERLARKIEEANNLPVGWLDKEEQEPPKTRIPLLSWVQAGHWTDATDQSEAVEWEDMGVSLSKQAFALKVRGDSMEPKFPEGATIIVEPEEPAVHGRYVVVHSKGANEATFKQLVHDGGNIYLRPLNPRYPVLEMEPDAEIIGVVVRMSLSV